MGALSNPAFALLGLWLVLGAIGALVLTLNLVQFGRPLVEMHTAPTRPIAAPEARALHPQRLPLLRAALALALLLAVAFVAGGLASLLPLVGAALPLAVAVAPASWAERRWADMPARATSAALAIGTGAAVLALVNAQALAQGGPAGWLPFLQRHLERPEDALLGLIGLALVGVATWGVPCALVTDLRVRDGARLGSAVTLSAVAFGPSLLALAILEAAYRLAAALDRRLEAPP